MRPLRLRRGEDRRLAAGHLWIFSNEVDTRATPLTDFAPGEEALVTDSRGRVLGSACVSPGSLICARLHARDERPLDADLLRERLTGALALRRELGLGDFCRLVHGEGDFLPGLVVDRFGGHLTLQLTTAAMEARKDLLREVLDDLLAPSSLLWDNTVPARRLEALSPESVCEGPVPEELEVPENGCLFAAPCREGQKTGWFYDQRDNRARVAALARGREVLDAFCYAGGFGVAAAKAGARSVLFADASAKALDFAARNAARNAPGCAGETLQGDAFETLRELRRAGRRFDIVCIDPPAFIRRRKEYREGLTAYRRLNALACSLVRDGGFLVTSSCSHALSADDLRACAARACAARGLHPRLLRTGWQAADHPVHCAMPETAYLKCLLIQMIGTAPRRVSQPEDVRPERN